MKKIFVSLMAILMVAMMMFSAVSVSAGTETAKLDTNTKVGFVGNCDKEGYTFNVYKIADLNKFNYGIKFDSKINDADVKAAIAAGSDYDKWHNGATNTAEVLTNNQATQDLLDALDALPESSLGGIVDTFTSTDTVKSKEFKNLTQGIYYVRAVNFPAGVKAVTNSVFALPYYTEETGWVYTIPAIPLAAKVLDEVPENHKIITNSTRNSEEYSDNSLGDVINYQVTTDVVGTVNPVESHNFKLNSYVLTDIMSKGLTFDKNSVGIKITKEDGTVVETLKNSDFTVEATGAAGQATNIKISLTKDYLQKNSFYGGDKVVYTYTGTLNEYAVLGKEGNPNEDVKLEYSNKNDVKGEVPGNTVWVYTWGIELEKYDETGTNVLGGADFSLYATKADAQNNTNVLGTGTSTAAGKVTFRNAEGKEVKLESGTYYAIETKAPTGYNRYTDPIEIKIDVTYDSQFNATAKTWVKNAPEIGKAVVGVNNSKSILPQTGGMGDMPMYIIGVVALMFAGVAILFYKKRKAQN
jgi:LPXTG-motif cell wall-anchored protein